MNTFRRILILILGISGCLNSFAQEVYAPMQILFDKPSPSDTTIALYGYSEDYYWENSSLPIGNGAFGANILGSVALERITLNEKSLWRGGPNTAGGAEYYWNVNKNSVDVLGEIRQAFLEGDNRKAARLTRENFNGYAAYEDYNESPFRFGSYTTMGEIYIETGVDECTVTDYKRLLSLDSAFVDVSFNSQGVNYSRRYFASYPDSVMVWRFNADVPAKQNLKLRYNINPESEVIFEKGGDNEILYRGRLKSNSMEFALRVGVDIRGGSVEIDSVGVISVIGADDVIFVLAADTDYKENFNPDFSDAKTYVGINPVETTFNRLKTAKVKDYQTLYDNHIADYRELFSRVKLDLNRFEPMTLEYPPVWELPTYERLERYRKGMADYALEELYFQYGRYLMIASSREGSMAANLQGLWSKGVDGPWRVDYHNNINVQMNYWPATTTNLLECYQPMIDYIRTLVKPGAVTAASYYGARGWTASISSNIFGFTAPLSSEDMSWNFSPMAGPWLATHLWEYYDFSRDYEFLEEIGYEIIASSADFVVDYLWKHPDGYYTAAPSTSPEHGPIDKGATFVHAVAREILTDAIEASEVVGKDYRRRREWRKVLRGIVPYKVGRYGQLMEWSEDIDNPEDDHRHVNHLYGLHPGHTLSPMTTPELAQASKVVLNHRGDGATGWSMGWKLNQWARLHDGNRAYKLFGNLLKGGTLDNLWDTHPPFQIDGNFGGTAGITEMLLQSHMGFIHLLPALPDAWSDGEVSGLLSRGNFEVKIDWREGKLYEARIISRSGEDCEVVYDGQKVSFGTRKGGEYVVFIEDGKLKFKK